MGLYKAVYTGERRSSFLPQCKRPFMSIKQHIYTLPEPFLKDQSVPARWRVWAVINGFFIGGKNCWASNEWLGEQIGAHKDTVSQAVKELEGIGMLVCKRTARTRLISPCDPMVGDSTYLRSALAPISDRHQRLPTSDSNADNTSGADAPIVIVKDETQPKPSTAKYPHKKEVFALWGKYPRSWDVNRTQCAAAENLYVEHGVEGTKKALAFLAEHDGEAFLPEVSSPHDLDSKWAKIIKWRNKQ